MKSANINMPPSAFGGGGMPQMLLNCNFDLKEYRRRMFAANVTVLRDDEHKMIQQEVVQLARSRTTIVNDLVANGCGLEIPNGLGVMVLEYENISDMSAAQMSMAAEAAGDGDRPVFDQAYLPLPVTHHDFSINARALQASRNHGTPLSTTQSQIAALKVGEKIEQTFAVGASSFTHGTGTIYGLLDFPLAQSYTCADAWDESSPNPLADVIGMKALAQQAHHFGPYMVYIPPNWSEALDDDLKAASDKSLYTRLKEVQGIIDVKVCDFLTADYMVLVEFQPSTIQAVIGLQPTTLEWATMGGLVSNYKVMSIAVPLIRADQAGNSGVVIGTP